MQFDRSADGTLTPLPKPSVDTGAGLERITAVLQGQDDNFHTDLFRPLIADVERLVGAPYPGGPEGTGISYRVLADHARAVSFLLLDGVYPSNEGRGFVLRRILRRAVRHAWLLGRREPTLVELVPTVVALMGEAYPVLVEKQAFVAETIRQEEARFLETIEAGLSRLEEIRAAGTTRIAGDEAFKLFDTFGFPLDLTVLIAEEMGISVDTDGFDVAMTEQRERSRAAAGKGQTRQAGSGAFTIVGGDASLVHGRVSTFVGYTELAAETDSAQQCRGRRERHPRAARVALLRHQRRPAGRPRHRRGRGVALPRDRRASRTPSLGSGLLGTLEGSFAPRRGARHGRRRASRAKSSATTRRRTSRTWCCAVTSVGTCGSRGRWSSRRGSASTSRTVVRSTPRSSPTSRPK